MAFVLGHNLTPHDHADLHVNAVCSQEAHEAKSLFQVIVCFFHPDLGNDHLEEFQLPQADFNPGFLAGNAFHIDCPLSAKAFISCATNALHQTYLLSPPLRGPPYLA